MGIAVELRRGKYVSLTTTTARAKDFKAVEVLDESSAKELDEAELISKRDSLVAQLGEINEILAEIAKLKAKP